jgi:hypothetical protein
MNFKCDFLSLFFFFGGGALFSFLLSVMVFKPKGNRPFARRNYRRGDKINKTGDKRNTKVRSRNRCCGGKGISITYCECVSLALVIQNAMRMRRIILSSVN